MAAVYICALIASLVVYSQAADIPVAWKSPLAQTNINAKCGDRLIFTFTRAASTVAQIKSASCKAAMVKNWGNSGSVTVPVTTGLTYFKSATGQQCSTGKILLTVNTTCPPPPPPPSPSPSPASSGKTIVVVNNGNNPTWVCGRPFPNIQANCGDTLQFIWKSGPHSLVSLPDQGARGRCDFSNATVLTPATTSSVTNVLLTKPGTTYYACSVADHCRAGQKVTVTTTC